MEKELPKKNARIFLDKEDWGFIQDYKEATGLSLQGFVTKAIKDRINWIRSEVVIRDIELMDTEDKEQAIRNTQSQLKDK